MSALGQNVASAWKSVDRKLADLGVPASLRRDAGARLRAQEFQAALLYGSWARGDADSTSDLDVLLVGVGSGPVVVRNESVSIARYSPEDLRALSGTLFGFHLARDGVLLYDTNYQLAHAIAAIKPPAPGAIIARARALALALDVSEGDRREYIEGLTKVARYLLRTAMYAQALDAGRPCFSVRELAIRNSDPALVAALSSHESVRPAANAAVFNDLRGRLAAVVGDLPPNPYGSLHRLIEESWSGDRELSSFATLILADEGDELPYDELPRVTL